MASNGSEGRPVSPIRPMATLDETPLPTTTNRPVLGEGSSTAAAGNISQPNSGGATFAHTASEATVLCAAAATDADSPLNCTSIKPYFQPLTIVCNTYIVPDDWWTEFRNATTTIGANHDEPLSTRLPNGRSMDWTDYSPEQLLD
uniref:Uncharacterized protein n=1 Tax=Lactuca sativa TaxID=4236 RepID=A0A9R1XCG9_LACSA|nr:hypothetical protein LSAT_V11C500237870 [Lactuca sativa]